jgi:RNase adaptor protein for sRNA GlmZ degradation
MHTTTNSPATSYRKPDLGTGVFLKLMSYAMEERPQTRPTIEVDCTTLRCALGQQTFRERNGLDPEVQAWLLKDAHVQAVVKQIEMLVEDYLKVKSSKWLCIGVADVHGTHTAPAIVEVVSRHLVDQKLTHTVEHYELPRPASTHLTTAMQTVAR